MSNEQIQNTIKSLKENPVFAMSLGGKELFHSNFLAWLFLEGKSNQNIKKYFGLAGHDILEVYREKFHMDLIVVSWKDNSKEKEEYTKLKQKLRDHLSIMDQDSNAEETSETSNSEEKQNQGEFTAGEVKELEKHIKFLVIENKFKSVPYWKQLDEYSTKIHKKESVFWINQEGKTNKVWFKLGKNPTSTILFAPKLLLDSFSKMLKKKSSSEEFNKKKDDVKKKWSRKSYEGYLKSLEIDLGEHDSESDEKRIVSLYHKMTSEILDNLLGTKGECQKDIKKGLVLPNGTTVGLLKSIRMHDIYTKVWYARTQTKFVYPEEYEMNTGYTNGTGLWEWKTLEENKFVVGVQVQHFFFRVFVTPYNKKDSVATDNNNIPSYEMPKNEDAYKAIETWASSIIAKLELNGLFTAGSTASPLHKYDDFKYVYRQLDSSAKRETLIAAVNKALILIKQDDEKKKTMYEMIEKAEKQENNQTNNNQTSTT